MNEIINKNIDAFKNEPPVPVASTLNLFNIKQKKPLLASLPRQQPNTERLEVNKNFAGRAKYFPPAITEWFNSTYAYNKNKIKLMPTARKITFKLIKSYFNIYSRKLEKKIRSRRLRMRVRRLSTNRILISKPDIKHTNDKAIVNVYVYNRQKKYYLNKIKRIASIDNIDNLLPNYVKKDIIDFDEPWPSNLKMKTIRKKTLKIRSEVSKHKSMAGKTLNIKNKANYNKFNNYDIIYLKNYLLKCLRREILSVYFKQLITFNKSKFEERYLLPLTSLVKRVYNKEIEFNLVNLKYLHFNSHIFSETLLTKLRNRKNKLLRVLKTSLLMFKLPPMDRTAVYDEIYNRKRKLQNLKVEEIISDYLDNKPDLPNKDILEFSLSKLDLTDSLTKLRDFTAYWPQSETHDFHYPLYITNTIFKLMKHKYVSGIRIEVAGRLTRRNTADRSVFKLRYKGNIKNMDSSYKGLPSALLRGYAKSNLQYSNLKSKIRIGSFGLKGWVSSS